MEIGHLVQKLNWEGKKGEVTHTHTHTHTQRQHGGLISHLFLWGGMRICWNDF